MNNTPLVSVIIPNYNHARYLDQRLQSVLGQTYQNFELIILDDCSTDNSLEVIAKYKANPHVSQVVVNEQNSGSPFKQWDKGIHLAKGELIWIAESDDYCELNMLEELVNAYTKRKGIVLAYCTSDMVDENGYSWSVRKPCVVKPFFDKGGFSFVNIYNWIRYFKRSFRDRTQYIRGKSYLKRYLSMYCSVPNASCAIFDKQVVLNIGTEWLTIEGAGDYMFWTQLVEHGNVVINNKVLNYFRRHSSATTSRLDASGVNMIANKMVLDRIYNDIHISMLRMRMILCNKYTYFCWVKFESDETKEYVSKYWNFPYESQMGEFMLKLWNKLKKWNLYI